MSPSVHRIWLRDEMPEAFAEFGEKWRALHPEWELVDWQDPGELPPLVNQDLFDRAEEICPKDWRRFETDILRLELLYRYGGLYVDCDVEPLQRVDGLLDGCTIGYSPQTRNGKHPLTNAVMAAPADDPFIAACVQALPESVRRFHGRSLAYMAGPWHLTRVYERGEWNVSTPDLYSGEHLVHHWNNARRKAGKGLG